MNCTPVPIFNQQPNIHITKKKCIEQGLPLKASVVPKSPVKKCLTISSSSGRADSVSFIDPSLSPLSIIYDPTCDKTYFEQCFYNIELIGEGSFGVVFSVRFREDDQFYAIKKSKTPFYSNNDKKNKLEEVRKHEMIPKHPNCVQLYRSWVEDDFLYLQLELCETSLEHYASENHNISEEMLWNILADMLLAIKNLHDNNLIHLDIKLENILISSNGTCKLADFGLVSDLNTIKEDTLEGDQKYLAPELLSGHFTKAADIFSLGIVMLELACDLLLPSNGILWQQLRNDIFPDYIQNTPPTLMEVIKKMMSSNYLNRPTVDDLLKLQQIQNLLAVREVSSRCQILVPKKVNLCDTCISDNSNYIIIEDSLKATNPKIINLCDTCISDNSIYIIEDSPKAKNITETRSALTIESTSSTPSNMKHLPTNWTFNISISPIRDDVAMASQWDRFITRKQKKIQKPEKNNHELMITSTPKCISRRSRLNGVGRRLF